LSPAGFLSPNICSGQAIAPGEGGVPVFDREKCVHCGACIWNCAQPLPDNPERTDIAFRAGGLRVAATPRRRKVLATPSSPGWQKPNPLTR
jgi:dissimilatory sulfite reductase (desulfoviridin) alpha/beta subunit